MRPSDIFTQRDLEQIKKHGLSLEAVMRQLEQFRNPPPYIHLVRPCTVGDGIEVIDEQSASNYIDEFEGEVAKGRFLKFVPASGAATRMFRALQRYYNKGQDTPLQTLEAQAARGDKDAEEFLIFIRNLHKFAFYPELRQILDHNGLDVEQLSKAGQYRDIVRFVLGPEGLGYGDMPKALILFHRYGEKARTALEEHLVEAARYVSDSSGKAPTHFTVAHKHLKRFHTFLLQVTPEYKKQFSVNYEITLSLQKSSTDTIAVDLDGNPFRLSDGTLLFRPAGHGALIENLNDLHADMVFIKNIDNVVPDHLKPETYKWKKILGGRLVQLQNKIHGYLKILHEGPVPPDKDREMLTFTRDVLCMDLPPGFEKYGQQQRAQFYIWIFNRPIRVCGMVRNVGEPGGGPFWVKDVQGRVSRQIVEIAQIDPQSKEQQAILKASTHFNPVDLVCGLRDWEGHPFDLRKFVDHNAVFISTKSKDGKDLKALELPGLWNGAMADWITFFVEVPLITFNPVKTVNALLRPEHQPLQA